MLATDQIMKARARISDYINTTPLQYDPLLSSAFDSNVFLKLELQQVSGSFKARGAFNKITSAVQAEGRNDMFFVAASTGNHAAAFCSALRTLNLQGRVFLPVHVARSKLAFVEAMDIPYELVGTNSLQTEIHCRQVAENNGYILVHPYNDHDIVAGQGTIAAEILEQCPEVDCVIVPVGGGGLVAGIGSYLKKVKPEIEIIGCQPLQSPEMVESIKKGSIITEDISLPTLSDGTAGGIEPGSITFDICRKVVDKWTTIREEEIAFEINEMLSRHQLLIEGAAALPLAYLRKNGGKYKGKIVVLIISGKRITFEKLKEIIV